MTTRGEIKFATLRDISFVAMVLYTEEITKVLLSKLPSNQPFLLALFPPPFIALLEAAAAALLACSFLCGVAERAAAVAFAAAVDAPLLESDPAAWAKTDGTAAAGLAAPCPAVGPPEAGGGLRGALAAALFPPPCCWTLLPAALPP